MAALGLLGFLSLATACEDDPRDAYFGTDAGADYRLPPLLDARGDGNADQGDSLGSSDAAVDAASDALDAPLEVAPGLDLRVDTVDVGAGDRPADAADTSMSLDLAPRLDAADGATGDVVDSGGDAVNDATSG